MSVISSSCPAPVPIGTMTLANTARAGAAPPTSDTFSTGDYASIASAGLRANAARADISTRYGSGGYAVGSGLAVSIGTGLTVSVAMGHATCEGLVEVTAATVVNVNASSPREWVWLRQNGTFVVQNNTTAKPSGNCVLVGSAVTGASTVTSVDTDGVVYWRGGELYRETADTGPPADTLDSGLRLFTKTAKGLYFWDGSQHRRVGGDLDVYRLSVPSGSTEYVPDGFACVHRGPLTVAGTLIVDGRMVFEAL